MIYKQEFNTIWILFRFRDELSPNNQEKRIRQLHAILHPRIQLLFARGCRNLMVNLKDSFTDITSTALSSVSTTSRTDKVLAGQQRNVTKAQTELVGYTGTAFDPILEKHIGNKVVLEITNSSNTVEEHVGVLKEYSADFLAVLGLKYKDGDRICECDVIAPRAHSFIRHSNEPVKVKVAK